MANWQDDPKAIEAIDYLIQIGVDADAFEAYYDEEYGDDEDYLDDPDGIPDDEEDEEEDG